MRLEFLAPEYCEQFLEAADRSASLHRNWVFPPRDEAAFRAMVERFDGERTVTYLALDEADELVACFNLSEIVYGVFQSAYLGFYAFKPHAGKGLTRVFLRAVVEEAFETLELHRLEANIQPENSRSIALVESLGFQLEGFSPRYLFIDGAWRDHLRYAITAEDRLFE